MTPSWPQLAGWLATVDVHTLRCAWHEREDGVDRSGLAFFDRDLDLWVVEDAAGGPTSAGVATLLMPAPFARGDDYHQQATPVTAAVHDGRPCWQVSLHPPARKRGLLTLLVDDELGVGLQMRNDDAGYLCEVTALEVDVALDDGVFAAARAQRAAQAVEQELYHLVQGRPPPTPRWFPWRRTYAEERCLALESDRGDGFVSRVPLGQAPPTVPWFDAADVTYVDSGQWSWAVGSRPRLDAGTALAVVEQVVEANPFR